MKTQIKEIDLTSFVSDLDRDELMVINGGGFAYDLGFFLRECIISFTNGSDTRGEIMVITDVSLNYKPLN